MYLNRNRGLYSYMGFGVLILLAVIQGLTEFLPVSSSGHLVLLYNFFGIENNVKLLSILLHIATLLSVLIYYRKEIIILVRHPFCPTNRKLLVTTIVTCIVVLIFKPFIDNAFSGEWIFVFFIITAVMLFVSDYLAERNTFLSRTSNFKQSKTRLIDPQSIINIGVSYKQAIVIGLTQGIACIPGISRSGSTIAVSRMCGVEDSARYSFLISIPIIVASFVMEIFEGGTETFNINIPSLILAMVICFVIGLICIKVMTRLVSNNKMTWFAYYLIALATTLVIISFA